MTNQSGQPRHASPEAIRQKIEQLIRNFETELQKGELRPKVLALIPIFHGLRRLGKALVPEQYAASARDRILHYFREYPKVVIQGNELLLVSGIQEYARRVRELRVQFGWAIASGVTIKEMIEEDEEQVADHFKNMKPSDYVLLDLEQDRDAAHRWHVANTIRKRHDSVRDKLLAFFLANVGKKVTNEELRYVAQNRTEWARRVRELRSEFGWPIVTKTTGRPDLPIGAYLLESDRQSPAHDRNIPDDIRRKVLRRDGYKCTKCGWSHDEWNRSDPRHLELHHIVHHAKGGLNTEENLITVCTVCHDEIHRKQ
ncbi:MAG: HNH endonuclease signature motif containing protein [Candidatus Hydrogenedentes bacterium]|nr:HNH endonuclease signature motif containing protein [Candidatus Hydrogenedentota bacterium]